MIRHTQPVVELNGVSPTTVERVMALAYGDTGINMLQQSCSSFDATSRSQVDYFFPF